MTLFYLTIVFVSILIKSVSSCHNLESSTNALHCGNIAGCCTLARRG